MKLSEEEHMQNFHERAAPLGNINHALQDYQMQMMLLEQQNKKRLMMARHAPTAIAAQGPPSVSQGYRHKDSAQLARENNRAALRRMSHHDKPVEGTVPDQAAPSWERHEGMFGQEAVTENGSIDENGFPPNDGELHEFQPPRRHAIEDYNMQLMLLEQQNKKRLMMARHEQEILDKKLVQPAPTDLEAEQILEMEGALSGHEETHDKQNVSMPILPGDLDQEMSGDDLDEWDKVERADELTT